MKTVLEGGGVFISQTPYLSTYGGPLSLTKTERGLALFLEELLLHRRGKTMDLWIDGNEPR